MTAIMVFVLRDQTAQVRWLETAGVGVGVREMGNKGAVGVRMGYSIGGGSTLELTFVSAHLAPMEDQLQRRNDDWRNLVRGLVFTPVSPSAVRSNTAQRLPQESSDDTSPLLPAASPAEDSIPPMSGLYTPTSHLIVAGDLNYRTAATKPSPNAHLTWPQPSSDPNAKRHYSHLLPSDQLKREMQAERTCHGLQEAPITFPPTYKYSHEARSAAAANPQRQNNDDDDDDGSHWYWSQHRWPSWCDRILYLDAPPWATSSSSEKKKKKETPTTTASRVEVQGYKALPLMASSDHRPVACSFSVPAEAIPDPPEPNREEEREQGEGGEQQREGEEDGARKPVDVRLVPPFGLNPCWMEQREAARTKEVVVGMGAYLALTWEGMGILLAVVFGALGGWAVIASLLQR